MSKLQQVLIVITMLLLVSVLVSAQEMVIPAPTTGDDFLNTHLAGDTTATGARVDANRIYVLERGGIYFINTAIRNNGWTLRIKAQDGTGAKPIVYGIRNTTTNKIPDPFFDMRGHIWMKDLILVGFTEPIPGEVAAIPSTLIRTNAAGFDLVLHGCILTQTRGQHIRTESALRVGKFYDCIWANLGDLPTSNLGAGKAIDLRSASCDSLVFINNTFVNFQDRIIRHRSSTASINHFIFDHNTLVNGMSYHGTIALGWLGREAVVTNNLFIDTFICGQDTDAVRQSEFDESGEKDEYGKARMTWFISVPNDTTKWKASGNYYSVSSEVQALYDKFASAGVKGEGSPFTYHMNSKLGADSANAFKKELITLVNRPHPMIAFVEWYRSPAGGNKTKSTTNFPKETADYDRRNAQYFADTLDCSYPFSASAFTGAALGFPAGDLNWFPDKKAQWGQMAAAMPIAAARIDADGDFNADLKGQVVTVVGVITSPNYRPSGAQYWMQDETGGINIYAGSIKAELKIGDIVRITGKIDQYRGLVEIVPSSANDILIIASGTPVSPRPVTAAEFIEANESTLIQVFRYRLVDPATWPAAGKWANCLITNGTDTINVYIAAATDMPGQPAPAGWFNLVGVMEQFTTATPANNGYEIRPRSLVDFQIITNVADRDPNLPTSYALSQNYPNPFNPVTTISFDLPESEVIKIRVYDLLGKVIATLHEGKLAAGYHKFTFSGVNVPSGIYFYRVESRNFTDVKKMTLIK